MKKQLPYQLRNDFLNNAQRLDPLVINVEKNTFIENLEHKFCSFGSCFAQNLQTFIKPFRFEFYFERQVCAYYHSLGMEDLLERLVDGFDYTDDLIYKFSDQDFMAYQYFRLRLYGNDAKERVRTEMKRLDGECKENLTDCDTLITTFGTSVYRKKTNGRTLNCIYGMSMENTEPFAQQSVEDIIDSLTRIEKKVDQLRHNKPFNWILTISPQRYSWSSEITGLDKFLQNQICKSKYVVAINEFVRNKSHANNNIIYYPSYEIVIDELRLHETLSTYDHLHINQDLTPMYVVKKFLKSYCSQELLEELPMAEDLDALVAFTKNRMEYGAPFNSSLILPAWDMFEEKLETAKRIDKIKEEFKDLKISLSSR
jgi:hypothetical protein